MTTGPDWREVGVVIGAQQRRYDELREAAVRVSANAPSGELLDHFAADVLLDQSSEVRKFRAAMVDLRRVLYPGPGDADTGEGAGLPQ